MLEPRLNPQRILKLVDYLKQLQRHVLIVDLQPVLHCSRSAAPLSLPTPVPLPLFRRLGSAPQQHLHPRRSEQGKNLE